MHMIGLICGQLLLNPEHSMVEKDNNNKKHTIFELKTHHQ